MIYVELAGTYHDLMEGGVHTRCGLDVPYGSPYIKADSGQKPDKLCGDCFPGSKKKGK